MEQEDKKLVNFVFELGQLRHLPRTGWLRLGMSPEKLSDHTARAAQIAYFLAYQEKHSNPALVATMMLFHEIAEARCHDLDYVARTYVQRDELKALKAQTEPLGELGKEIQSLWIEVEEAQTEAGIIAKDADYLENAFTARELQAQGCQDAQVWLDSIESRLKTATAKRIFKHLCMSDPNEWWKLLC